MSTQWLMLRKWFFVLVCSATLFGVSKISAQEPETASDAHRVLADDPFEVSAQEPEAAYDTTPIRVGASTAEERIREKLLEPTTLEFSDAPLKDVLAYIEESHQLAIEIDARALDDIGVDIGSPVTRSLENIALHSALDLILSDLDLTYVIDSEVLMITNIEEAETTLHLVIYPVTDLLPHPKHGPITHDALMEVIVTSVDPTTWDEVGGPGSIVGFLDSIIVSQSDEVHEHIHDLLKGLRRLSSSEGRSHVTVRGDRDSGGGGFGGGGESHEEKP